MINYWINFPVASNSVGGSARKSIAIVIDDTVWSAPRVLEEIRMGKCMISGDFTKEEVQALQIRLDPIH